MYSNRDIGLSYYIDYLVVLNDEDSRTFNVVQDGGWADILDARVRGKWKNAFNRNTNFQYRSFGFDDYQNQHYLYLTNLQLLWIKNIWKDLSDY